MKVTIQINQTEGVHFSSFTETIPIYNICKSYIKEDFKPYVVSSTGLPVEDQIKLDKLINQLQEYWKEMQTQLSLDFG